jgi:hypothetical protein
LVTTNNLKRAARKTFSASLTPGSSWNSSMLRGLVSFPAWLMVLLMTPSRCKKTALAGITG